MDWLDWAQLRIAQDEEYERIFYTIELPQLDGTTTSLHPLLFEQKNKLSLDNARHFNIFNF